MSEELLKAKILDLEKKIEILESTIQDLQAQQLSLIHISEPTRR